MRLVRLKPQGPGPDRGPDARYNENLQSKGKGKETYSSLQAPKLFSRHVNVCLVMSLFAPNCNYLF